jgi:hypothetical protein
VVGEVSGDIAAGLSQVVRRGDLRMRTPGTGVRRLTPVPFDNELLAAVDAATARGVPLGLVVPLPAADIPILLGAAAVTAEITRSWSVSVSVTVVSARLSQRARYDQLHVKDAALSSIIPRARLDADGTIAPVGNPYPSAGGGRLVLTGDEVAVRLSEADLHQLTGSDDPCAPAAPRSDTVKLGDNLVPWHPHPAAQRSVSFQDHRAGLRRGPPDKYDPAKAAPKVTRTSSLTVLRGLLP